MSTDEPDPGPSRRTVMKYGALATTGAVVGGVQHAGAVDDADGPDADADTRDAIPIEGVMFPYQFTPNARATVVESDINWQPTGIGGEYRSHVVEYAFAPSLHAFFFTDADATLSQGHRLEFGASPYPTSIETDRSLVGVDATALE